MKKHLLISILALLTLPIFADESSQIEKKTQPISIKFDMRADWEYQIAANDTYENASAFSGKYLDFQLDGNITDKLSYSFRYSLNRLNLNRDFFEATDWANINYQFDENWKMSAGKQIVGIGGFEYDAAPINVYFASDFWNHVVCYEFGISGQYTTNDKKNDILFQISNSPFTSSSIRFDNLYSYNLMWYGRCKNFSSIYSVNLVEYDDSKYISYIALGNKLNFGDLNITFDYMNRYGGKGGFFDDFSVIGKVDYTIVDKVNIFVKAGYDQNLAQNATTFPTDIVDRFVLPGVSRTFYGAGVEYYPLPKTKNLRLHAYFSASDNSNEPYRIATGATILLNAFERK